MWKESHRVHCGEKVGTEAEAHGTHTGLLLLQTSFNLQPCGWVHVTDTESPSSRHYLDDNTPL